MDTKCRTPKYRITIITIILLIAGLGCLCLPGSLIPTSPPTQISSPTPLRLSPVAQAPIANTVKLNAEGPWLLMETDQGLWATNPDGSGMTQLTNVDYWQGDLQNAVQPGGTQVVFITPGSFDFHHMALNLLSLPDGHVTKVTDLTSPETETYADAGPGGSVNFDALRAVGEQRSYAWSPDGARLAFVGVMDGPSAEIYLYDAASGQIKRVSQDDAQNYWPSWSPDGNNLLYLGADTFGTGAGLDTTGVWSVRGDGTNVTWLYVPKGGAEELVGWLDNTTAVFDTWTPVCGSERLRLFDIVSTKTVMLNEECFISAAASGWRGEALFANSSGLYLLTAEARTPVSVSQDPVAHIDPWGPDDYLFTARFENGGIATFGSGNMDYQVSPINAPSGNLEVAMYGAIWGWTSNAGGQPGAWITGPGVEIGQIFPGKARLPIWDLHNNLLFFAPEGGGGYSIYRTTFDAYYQDLSAVASINAEVLAVTWLGAN
jgi:hypothetical protein